MIGTEPIWEGRTVVIAASGPSLSIQLSHLIGRTRANTDRLRVITVNDAVYPMWFADLAYASDAPWWVEHEGLPRFSGKKVRPEQIDACGVDTNKVPFDGFETVRITGVEGFDETPGHIRSGGNSGYAATHLAVHLGAEKIILVGFDMDDKYLQRHFFGDHPRNLQRSHAKQSMQGWRNCFDGLAKILRGRVKVYNASPNSALRAFPKCDIANEMNALI